MSRFFSSRNQPTPITPITAPPVAAAPPVVQMPISVSVDGVATMPLMDVSQLGVEQSTASLIEHAVRMGASDVFVVANESHYAVQVRYLGMIHLVTILQPDEGRRMVAYMRNNAGVDQERRKPADGRWIYRNEDSEGVDLRLNFLPTMYGEDVAIRLLVRGNALYKIEELGMANKQLQLYLQMLSNPSGLILITGPTGSGKTATLYASLMHLNDGRRKINTIEDPIEYAVEGLRQSQVNPAIELGFAEVLRAILRQSPDVIMVGEVRDAETAQTAVRAANSGMLVFATLHAPDAASAVQAMRAFGVPPHFLSTSLRGVISQRLMRTLDPTSRLEFDITDAPLTFEEIQPYLAPGEGGKLYAPGPSPSNQMTGYSGRTGIFEVWSITPAIRQMISEGASSGTLREIALAEGLLPFRHAALLKVAMGETSTEEILRAMPSEQVITEE